MALTPGQFNLLPGSKGIEPEEETQPESIEAVVRPNPVKRGDATFEVRGPDVEDLQVTIYDLAGKKVFTSGWQPGPTLLWDLRNDDGERLANGAYIFILCWRDAKSLVGCGKPKLVFLSP